MNSRRFALVMMILSTVALFAVLGMRETIRAAREEAAGNEIAALASEDLGLPVLGSVTDFSLTDSTGAPLGLGDLRGSIWVADFFFTSCESICPALTINMRSVQRALAGDPAVRFVSVTVDPITDTPSRLAEYATEYKANFDTWHFLTGPIDDIQHLAVKGFKVGSVNNPVVHSDRFILVDPAGAIRGYYVGTDESAMPQLIEDIEALKTEFGT